MVQSLRYAALAVPPSRREKKEPSRRVAAVAWKGVARACLEPPPVQILEVVANTQVRTLRTEVGEGFHVNSVCTWVSRSLANGQIRARRDFTSHAMDER
ncbi:hypothetical protein NPIL_21441 [Nephila pilipes]|uniref:Uncharacterized protein n=1 Tax=Nephila pilipes TaxID=299642 RepID=A0A8X6Q365_NEPPI|nr:hypothetical protein NPIL_21441 [Nephila pilipes]